jgi:hypothetical protein
MFRTSLQTCVMLLTLSGLAPAVFAQDQVARTTTTTADRDDDGFDMGWIGLLGLIGLAGLAGRNRAVTHSTTRREEVGTHR